MKPISRNKKFYLTLVTLRSLNEFGTIISSIAILLHVVSVSNNNYVFLIFIIKNLLSVVFLFIGGKLSDYSKKLSMFHIILIFMITCVLYLIPVLIHLTSIPLLLLIVSLSISFNAITRPYLTKLNYSVIAKEDAKKAVGVASIIKDCICLPAPILGTLLQKYYGLNSVLIVDAMTYLLFSVGLLILLKSSKISSKNYLPDVKTNDRGTIQILSKPKYLSYEIINVSVVEFLSMFIQVSMVLYLVQNLKIDSTHFGSIQGFCYAATIISGILFTLIIFRYATKKITYVLFFSLGVLYLMLPNVSVLPLIYIIVIFQELIEDLITLTLRASLIKQSNTECFGQTIAAYKNAMKLSALFGSIASYYIFNHMNFVTVYMMIGGIFILAAAVQFIYYHYFIKSKDAIHVCVKYNPV